MDKNSYLINLSESENAEFGKIDFQNQSTEQKVFSAIWGLEGQVNNGGFSQYFSSWDGDTANFSPVALRKIGANNCANIVERALKLVSQSELPNDQDERSRLKEELSDEAKDKLYDLSSEFFTYPDDLTELLYGFVYANPNTFGKTPS
jgi:Domain of unknown function (DUF4375)